jgi:hypothetical protein
VIFSHLSNYNLPELEKKENFNRKNEKIRKIGQNGKEQLSPKR